MYYIHLAVSNGADMKTTTVSSPVLVDAVSPLAGSVKDGLDFNHDTVYQSSTTTMEGKATQ